MRDKTQHNLISAADADKLIRAHDGDVALLCIYYLRSGSRDIEKAAAELCRTMGEIRAADEKLMRLGILDGKETETVPREPARELPQYTAKDISQRSREDENFSLIVSEAERVLGRKLNSNDLKVLFGVYDYLALPVEVILVMLNYLAEVYYAKYGDSRRPSANAIEKEAYSWAHREIFTLDQADEYIAFMQTRSRELDSIRRMLNIHDRGFSATERKDVASWLDMGFTEESIAIAYDRTIIKTGTLRWNYMRKIILNWHEHGLHSAKDIEEKDPVRGSTPAAAAVSGGVYEMDERILEDI